MAEPFVVALLGHMVSLETSCKPNYNPSVKMPIFSLINTHNLYRAGSITIEFTDMQDLEMIAVLVSEISF